ncbi:MAG TPA: glycosyltransferase [Chloroflexi bacterium]|jgi:glycosyltransferase involved in cell wall biosynthesis|nr:glycosyltransferase [Chloroflexota bacterium]
MADSTRIAYDGMMAHAAALAAEGRHSEAIAAYRHAASTYPDQPGPHYELGLLHHARGEVPEAIASFERTAALVPDDASIWNNLGVLHYAQGHYTQAEECYRRAVALDVDYSQAWYGLARTLDSLDEAIEAELAYRVCLRREPANARARERLDAVVPRAEAHATRHTRRLRVGFVSIWFERGQAYVTKMLRDALAQDHETFVFARTGGVYGRSMLETAGFWHVPNLHTFPDYEIPCDVLVRWIHENRLDAVVFNEEYDWNLVVAAKSTGVRVLTYLDYYRDEWTPLMRLYDGVLCSTLRTYNLVRSHCQAFYIGWAVDTALFAPADPRAATHTFFHNAGWLGIGYRKMTPAVITAFDMVSKDLPEVTLLVHAQVGTDKLPPESAAIVARHPRITYHVGTEPAPGLYHRGRILVFPSKLEGLGLPLPEGLACGLPAIATNAPPMNEFVIEGYNGLLVDVERTVTRADNIAFPETIVSTHDLADKMRALASAPDRIAAMGANARRFAEEQLSIDTLRRQLGRVLHRVIQDAPPAVSRRDRPTATVVASDSPPQPTVHLVGAQEANYPWGFENRLIAPLEALGYRVISTDYRQHRHDLAERIQQPASLVLVCRGEGIDPRIIRAAPCPTVLWYAEQLGTPDAADAAAMERRHELAFNIGAFDLVLSHDEGNLEVYRRLGAQRVAWLSTAAVDPAVHGVLDLPKRYDVTFVGTVTPRRAQILDALAQRCRLHRANVWNPRALNALYNESKIVLNLHLSDLPNTETRIAEVLGAGAFLITEALSSPHLLREGEHYVSVPTGDIAALHEAVAYYLAHDAEREAIARRGHAAILQGHTYRHRLQELLALAASLPGAPALPASPGSAYLAGDGTPGAPMGAISEPAGVVAATVLVDGS